MKNSILIIFSMLFLFSCKDKKKAPEKIDYKEINFVSGKFQDILNLAEKEDKLIFVDCYTSWCAPCKWMEKFVFVKEEVYSFYNSNFINYKIDMEKGEGPELAKKYNVQSFPTYLFLNSDGELVHLAKSKMEAEQFIEQGKNALNPKKALGILYKKYEKGSLSTEEMLNYAVGLKNLRDPNASKVFKKIMTSVDNQWLKSKSGWELIETFVDQDTSSLFKFLDRNKSHFIALVGIDRVNKVYSKIITRKMYASSRKQDATLFLRQLDSLKKISNNHRSIAIIHCQYYLNGLDGKKFTETSNYYVNSYLKDDAGTIAFLARTALRKADKNKDILQQAAVLIDKAYQMDPDNYGIVGTYATIQAKIGNKKKAVLAARKAVKIADTISSKIKRLAEENLKEIKAS